MPFSATPPVRGLPRELRTCRRVLADLTEASSSEMIDPVRGVAPDGRAMSADSIRRGRAAAIRARRFRKTGIRPHSEKPYHNDEHGTGSLVAGQRPAAVERRGRRLFELVR